MDIKKANTGFSVEQLLTGQLRKDDFQIPLLPMWKMLDDWERKVGGFDKVPMKDIFERIYEFGIIGVSLDKADMTTRIEELNRKNLEWFTKAMHLEKEVELLKTKLLESQSTKQN